MEFGPFLNFRITCYILAISKIMKLSVDLLQDESLINCQRTLKRFHEVYYLYIYMYVFRSSG